jgi:hypothetical protein
MYCMTVYGERDKLIMPIIKIKLREFLFYRLKWSCSLTVIWRLAFINFNQNNNSNNFSLFSYECVAQNFCKELSFIREVTLDWNERTHFLKIEIFLNFSWLYRTNTHTVILSSEKHFLSFSHIVKYIYLFIFSLESKLSKIVHLSLTSYQLRF